MPLATNPNRTAPAWLKCDVEIPEETRPVFLCRFLTSFQLDALYQELEEIIATKEYDQRNARLTAFLAKGIVGWRNMVAPGADGSALYSTPIDFAPDRFDRVLSVEEKFELANLMLTRPRATEVELKKSPSSAPTAPDTSAADATQQESAQKNS